MKRPQSATTPAGPFARRRRLTPLRRSCLQTVRTTAARTCRRAEIVRLGSFSLNIQVVAASSPRPVSAEYSSRPVSADIPRPVSAEYPTRLRGISLPTNLRGISSDPSPRKIIPVTSHVTSNRYNQIYVWTNIPCPEPSPQPTLMPFPFMPFPASGVLVCACSAPNRGSRRRRSRRRPDAHADRPRVPSRAPSGSRRRRDAHADRPRVPSRAPSGTCRRRDARANRP